MSDDKQRNTEVKLTQDEFDSLTELALTDLGFNRPNDSEETLEAVRSFIDTLENFFFVQPAL